MIEDILNGKFSDYLVGLDIYEDGKSIKLAKIVIKDEFRGSGIGTEIMNDLVNYADKNKKIVTLTASADFGGNKNRLVQFYKRFGFKLNKGIYKSYEYMDSMIRYPKMNEGSSMKTLIKNLLRENLNNLR